MPPPGNFLKFGSLKWHFLHFEGTFEQVIYVPRGACPKYTIYILPPFFCHNLFCFSLKKMLGMEPVWCLNVYNLAH